MIQMALEMAKELAKELPPCSCEASILKFNFWKISPKIQNRWLCHTSIDTGGCEAMCNVFGKFKNSRQKVQVRKITDAIKPV